MKITLPFLFLFLALTAHAQVLRTADYVDVSRYVGKWYTIEALPQFFTRSCKGQTAEGTTTISGKAVVKNKKTNAELVVTFNNFWTRLFRVKGDYTIIKLDENYEYVLVGSKDRKSLWILSRHPVMPEDVIKEYEAIATEEGFQVSRLQRYEY